MSIRKELLEQLVKDAGGGVELFGDGGLLERVYPILYFTPCLTPPLH